MPGRTRRLKLEPDGIERLRRASAAGGDDVRGALDDEFRRITLARARSYPRRRTGHLFEPIPWRPLAERRIKGLARKVFGDVRDRIERSGAETFPSS
jgi:hypothetical protein